MLISKDWCLGCQGWGHTPSIEIEPHDQRPPPSTCPPVEPSSASGEQERQRPCVSPQTPLTPTNGHPGDG